MVDWANAKNTWMQPDVRREISQFQDTQIEEEFSSAVEQHRVEEIYWVGGEPLMYEQHWRYMRRIIELGDGQNVYYLKISTNQNRYRIQLDCFVIPSTLPTGWTNPASFNLASYGGKCFNFNFIAGQKFQSLIGRSRNETFIINIFLCF